MLASQGKLTRLIVPVDSYTDLCVALMLQSDTVLRLAQRIVQESEAGTTTQQFVTELADYTQQINLRVDCMQGILRAILDEQPPPLPETTHGRA